MNKSMQESNFSYMLAGLLVLMLLTPMLSTWDTPPAIMIRHVVTALTLGISVWSLVSRRRAFFILIGLFAVSAVLSLISISKNDDNIFMLASLAQLAFWATCLGYSVKILFTTGPVNVDRIAGSICIYFLVAVIWAYFYLLMSWAVPGSIDFPIETDLQHRMPAMIYYSVVTLTTLGYGDITPVSPLARSVAGLEAMFGQFYIAILVAGIVGTHISQRHK